MSAKREIHSIPQEKVKMAESLLADIPKEGEPLEEKDEEGKETSQESPSEEKTEQEKSPSQEGEEGKEPENTPEEEKVPFHKHPRFREIIRENKELKEAVEELSKFREDAEPKLKELGESKQPIPTWFANTFGESGDAWEQYQGYEKDLRQKIKDEIYGEQETLVKQQAKEDQKWSDWTITQLEQLKDEGLKFDQNELLKVLVDYKPVDDNGSLDFHKGYEILSKIKAADTAEKSKKINEKKKAAAATMEGGGGEIDRKYKTSKDLRHKDWTDLAV